MTAFFEITWQVSNAIGVIVGNIIERFFSPDPAADCITWSGFTPNIDWKACAGQTFGNVLGFIATILFYLIILITILIILFRVWFELLKAYVFIIFYVITAPIWIVFGLIPGRPLGFEKWLRGIFANIAVFPMVVGLFIAARIFLETFKSPDPHLQFSPPLVGQPNIDAFGAIIAFGVLLMSPTFLNMLRDALKVPSSKYTGAIMGTVAAGAGVASAPAQRSWAAMTRRDQQGNPAGVLSVAGSKAVNNTLTSLAEKRWVPGKSIISNTVQRRQNQAAGLGYSSNTELLHKNIEASRALGPNSYYGQQATLGVNELLNKKEPLTRQEKKTIKEAHEAGLLPSLDKKESEGGLNKTQRENLSLALKTDLSDLKSKTTDKDQPHAGAGTQQEKQIDVPSDTSNHNSHGNTVDVATINAQTVNAQKVNEGKESTEKGHPPTLTDAPQRFSETLLKSARDAMGSLKLEGAKADNKEAIERIVHKLEEAGAEGTSEQHHAVAIEILQQNEKKEDEVPKDHKES